MSNWWESLALGAIQGLTEYLPVSSSGHLVLAQHLFQVGHVPLAFDLFLHLATVLATVCYFFGDIWRFSGEFLKGLFYKENRDSEGWKTGWAIVAGTVVTAVVGLAIKPTVEWLTTMPRIVGVLLLVTGAIVFLPSRIKERCLAPSIRIGLIVGCAQGLAVLPGISRSGATIVAALLCGMSRQDSFRFSFLLSLPAIVGASLLELKGAPLDNWPSGWFAGGVVAFLLGLFALALLRRMVASGRWTLFAFYCLCVGSLAVLFV